MSDKPAINNIFGIPAPEPMTMLVGLTADMAATKQCISNIEQALLKQKDVLTVVAAHDERIKVLERDIIVDGQTKLKNIEEFLDKKEKAKETAAAVKAAVRRDRWKLAITTLISIALTVSGFLIIHVFIPHLDVVTTFLASLLH